MNNHPLITIGITCFNAENTISRAINSAINQTWPNFEIVIVDDCSSDNSLQVIEKIKNKLPNVKLVKHKENLGYPSALNTIIANASGDYIALFDDDDDNDCQRLNKQYLRLKGYEEANLGKPVLCYTNRRVFVDGKEVHSGYVNAIGGSAPEPTGTKVADYILWHKMQESYTWGQFGSCTLMSSKKTLNDFKFDPKFRRGAEWDLAIRLALQGGCFIAVDEPLVIQHKTINTGKAGKKPLEYTLNLRRKHKKYLKKNGVYLGSILQAYSRFYYFRKDFWKSRIYLILACIASPSKILVSEFQKKISNFK